APHKEPTSERPLLILPTTAISIHTLRELDGSQEQEHSDATQAECILNSSCCCGHAVDSLTPFAVMGHSAEYHTVCELSVIPVLL
ncbi:Hypothetical predicted protein, partial [Pelobates cultripes]